MSPEPFVSRAKAPPAKRSEKGYGEENVAFSRRSFSVDPLTYNKIDFHCRVHFLFIVSSSSQLNLFGNCVSISSSRYLES